MRQQLARSFALLVGLLRRDSYTHQTAILAGEAYVDSTIPQVIIQLVSRRLRPGDIVSVKGSHGSRMGEVVKRLLVGEPAPVPAKA